MPEVDLHGTFSSQGLALVALLVYYIHDNSHIGSHISRGWVQAPLGSGAGTVTTVIQRSLVHSWTTCQTVLDCDTEPPNKLRMLCADVCDVPIDQATAIGWMRIRNEGSKVKQVTVQMSHVCSDPPSLGSPDCSGSPAASGKTPLCCDITEVSADGHALHHTPVCCHVRRLFWDGSPSLDGHYLFRDFDLNVHYEGITANKWSNIVCWRDCWQSKEGGLRVESI